MTIDIVPFDGPLGAEVRDLDLSHEVDATDVFALLEGLRVHHVLVIREQPVDDDRLLELASWFGPQFVAPEGIPVFGTDEQGAVSVLSNRDDRASGRGFRCHTTPTSSISRFR